MYALVALATETLSGIPSIVYGLFGLLFFVYYLQWGLVACLSGVCNHGNYDISDYYARLRKKHLLAVPDLYREGSFGLGCWSIPYGISRSYLPAAIPGILGGIILAIGRTVGESAALIYTAGSIAAMYLNVSISTPLAPLPSICILLGKRGICISMPRMQPQFFCWSSY